MALSMNKKRLYTGESSIKVGDSTEYIVDMRCTVVGDDTPSDLDVDLSINNTTLYNMNKETCDKDISDFIDEIKKTDPQPGPEPPGPTPPGPSPEPSTSDYVVGDLFKIQKVISYTKGCAEDIVGIIKEDQS